MSISWYSYTLLLVSFVPYMFLKRLFHRKWLDRFHSRPQTLGYCAWLYASPYDPALSAGESDENRLIFPNKHKRFLFVSIGRYPILIFYPKVLWIFVKTFRFALVLYDSKICFCILFSFNSISVSFKLIYTTTAKTIASFSLKRYVSGSLLSSFPEAAILSFTSFVVVFQYIMRGKRISYFPSLLLKAFSQGSIGNFVAHSFWVICLNVSRTFVELCMETPYWCTALVHQYGRRKSTKTSGVHFSIKALSVLSRTSIRAQKHIF